MYFDRFVIATESLEFSAYYIVPIDLLMRLSIIYGSIASVIYPVFSKTYSENNIKLFATYYRNFYFLVSSIIFIPLLFWCLFVQEILTVWISREFSDSAYFYSLLISIGIFFNGLCVIPSRGLISMGYERYLSYFYFIGSFFYIFLSIIFVKEYGIIFACWLFVIRGFIELAILNIIFFLNQR